MNLWIDVRWREARRTLRQVVHDVTHYNCVRAHFLCIPLRPIPIKKKKSKNRKIEVIITCATSIITYYHQLQKSKFYFDNNLLVVTSIFEVTINRLLSKYLSIFQMKNRSSFQHRDSTQTNGTSDFFFWIIPGSLWTAHTVGLFGRWGPWPNDRHQLPALTLILPHPHPKERKLSTLSSWNRDRRVPMSCYPLR
jgi:hypothetical protein